MALVNEILHIVADEAGMEQDELVDECEFWDIGVDDILAKSIISRIHGSYQIALPPTTFVDNPSVADLKIYLNKRVAVPQPQSKHGSGPSSATKTEPLSLVLQGRPDTCQQNLFLLPDGSGSAMAYARLPKLHKNVCLIALNSPYLRAGTAVRFRVEEIAELWTTEIQRRQPHGPYSLGGWSAGGYYAFEVSKSLIRRGGSVESLVLIDSPCRLVYEALPMEVVQYLSSNDLMGNWGRKQPPDWLIDHFCISIRAIEDYMPIAMTGPNIPNVCIIWAEKGLLESDEDPALILDMSVKVTRMLIQRPYVSGAMGWEKLFPRANLQVAKMPGNHFTIVYPPHVESLGLLLRDVVSDKGQRQGQWETLGADEV